LKSIKGINPNSRKYQTSIAALKSRFGDSVTLASFYYTKLESLPGSKDPKKQLSTYEEVDKILANLALALRSIPMSVSFEKSLNYFSRGFIAVFCCSLVRKHETSFVENWT